MYLYICVYVCTYVYLSCISEPFNIYINIFINITTLKAKQTSYALISYNGYEHRGADVNFWRRRRNCFAVLQYIVLKTELLMIWKICGVVLFKTTVKKRVMEYFSLFLTLMTIPKINSTQGHNVGYGHRPKPCL
jgi:hypothetical protein